MFFEPKVHGQRVLIIVPTICTAVATLAVALRIRMRLAQGSGLLREDYFVLLGSFWEYCLLIYTIVKVLVAGAATPPSVVITDDVHALYIQLSILGFCLWAAAVSSIQIAALLFYVRLFGVKVWFSRICYLTMALVAAWFVGTVIADPLVCIPISKYWLVDGPGRCGDKTGFCAGSTLVHVVFDFFILILPFPIVWRLQKSVKSRVLLTTLFGMGVFATVCGVLRLKCLIHYVEDNNVGKQGDYLNVVFESIEVGVGLCCVCLPTLGPAIDRIGGSAFVGSLRALLTSQKASSAATGSRATQRSASERRPSDTTESTKAGPAKTQLRERSKIREVYDYEKFET